MRDKFRGQMREMSEQEQMRETSEPCGAILPTHGVLHLQEGGGHHASSMSNRYREISLEISLDPVASPISFSHAKAIEPPLTKVRVNDTPGHTVPAPHRS